jgi:hypothetical protein
MVNQIYLPAIKATIRENEIGNASPYILSFAKLGNSGSSFGFMQGDTNASQLARTTLTNILTRSGADQATVDRILDALSRPLPDGNPLSEADLDTVNAALNLPEGRALVDDMDDKLLADVLAGVDACLAVAAIRNLVIAPLALLYIAPWVNMSGPPNLMKAWLAGAAVHGVPPPSPPEVEGSDIATYLQAMSYF